MVFQMKKLLQDLILNRKTEDGQEVFTLDHRLPVSRVGKKKEPSMKEGRLDGRITENTK